MQDEYNFARLLPWHSWDPDGDVFVNVDGALGLMWKLKRAACETMPEEDRGALAFKLAALFRLLPEGTVCQLVVTIDPHVAPALKPYLELTREKGVFEDLAASRAQTLQTAEVTVGGRKVRARRVDLYFTLRVDPQYRLPGPAALAVQPRSFETRVRAAYSEEKRRLRHLANSCEQFFTQLGLGFRRANEEELMDWATRLFNPGRRVPREDLPIRDRVLCSNVEVDFDAALLRIGDGHFGVASITELAGSTTAGMLEALIEALPEGLLVLNIHVPSQREIQKTLATKKKLAFCQQQGGDVKADVEAIKAEVDQAMADVVSEGVRIVCARIHAVARGRTAEEAGDRLQGAINTLQTLGFGVTREEALAPTLFLQSMPLAYEPTNDRALKRGRTMEDLNLAHLLPLYGAFPGTRTADMVLLNRLGEIVNFSFFDSDVAPHGIVCGVSGSGKSVFSNNVIVNALRKGAAVFVLDRGESYKKIADALGGQFVRFDPNAPRCINPCGSELTNEKLIFLTDLFSEMITAGRADLPVMERNLLAQAIRRAFQGQEVRVSDVRQALSDQNLATCLSMFCDGGPYGRMFDGPCEVDFSRPLVVFELEDIAMNREVASVVLLAIIQRITDFCMKNRDREKYLIVDEAWTLLKSPATARFLENVFRTYRKYRTCALMVTQQVADFEGSAGEAIRANAPNRVFLRQTEETVQLMQRLLDLKDAEKSVLRTITTVKGAYSEMLIVTPSGSGVARLTQDPMTYWLTTTDPQDNEELRRLEARYGDFRKALQAASMRWPRGVRDGAHAG